VSAAPYKILYIAHYFSEEMRRTLGLTAEYSPGGMNKILPLLSLLAKDHELTMLSTGYSRRSDFARIPTHHETLDLGGRRIPVIYPGYLAVRYLSFLEIAIFCALECLRRKPDFIIFYNFRFETLLPALLAKLFTRVRIVCQFEDGLHVVFNTWSLRGVVFGALYRLGKSACDGATLVNGWLKNEFRGRPSVVIPFVLPSGPGASPAPSRVGLSHQPVVKVAYSGTLDTERGADIFLEAAGRLRGNSRLHFFVSGQGPLLARVLERAGRQENLTYAGLLGANAVEAHLREMDILVNPQKLSHPFARYSFPSKVMRYILMNKPIVSTAFPDISDVPAPGLFFFGNDDPGELARRLQELAERDIEIDYRALFEKFSEKRAGDALRALFQRLAAARA
jgi:glycosyltransferase involved in cell wall biosynthesis